MRIHARNWLLLLVLAALVAANVLLERPLGNQAAAGPLLDALDPGRVARIAIEAPGAPRLELVRNAAGSWTVPARFDFPALEFAVEELLARLRTVSRADEVGAERASHALFGVGESGTRIALHDRAGRLLADLVQGRPERESTGSYVRPSTGQAVYRAPRLAPVEADSARWLDTRLAAFDPGEVRGLAVSRERSGIAFDLVREPGGAWRPRSNGGGRPPSQTAVEGLLHVASMLFFDDVLQRGYGPGEGLGDPPETRLRIDAGEATEIWIGDPSGAGHRHATNASWEAPWLVSLPADSARVLFAAIEELWSSLDER